MDDDLAIAVDDLGDREAARSGPGREVEVPTVSAGTLMPPTTSRASDEGATHPARATFLMRTSQTGNFLLMLISAVGSPFSSSGTGALIGSFAPVVFAFLRDRSLSLSSSAPASL